MISKIPKAPQQQGFSGSFFCPDSVFDSRILRRHYSGFLRLAQPGLILVDADVGGAFVEAGADAQLPLGEPSEIADALDAITNRHANDLPFVDGNIIA